MCAVHGGMWCMVCFGCCARWLLLWSAQPSQISIGGPPCTGRRRNYCRLAYREVVQPLYTGHEYRMCHGRILLQTVNFLFRDLVEVGDLNEVPYGRVSHWPQR
jgi:hypothetical protein